MAIFLVLSYADAISQETILVDEVLANVPLKKCDSVIVSPMAFKNAGRSTISFTSMYDFTRAFDHDEFLGILKSTPCLITIMKSDNLTETIEIIESLNKMAGLSFENKEKYFLIVSTKIIYETLQNKTYNFNTYIIGPTKNEERELDIISLCPVLGQRYAMIKPGTCEPSLQHPSGKVLQVSWAGQLPYVSGAELKAMDIFAKAFNFTSVINDDKSFNAMSTKVHAKEREIGIGEQVFWSTAYQVHEYLPWMFVLTFPIGSQLPYKINSYDTLMNPFDVYIWIFTIAASICVFLTLVLIQGLWTRTSEDPLPHGWLFQDVVLCLTVAIDESIPHKWFTRRSFLNARRLLIIQWLMWANILSWGYKGILLSKLVTVTYNKPIDTLQQMDQSDLPFYIPDITILSTMVELDPRDVVKRIKTKGVSLPFRDVFIEDTNQKMENGEIMLMASDTHWKSLENRVHQSKEPLARFFTSCIVPRGSPLLHIFNSATHWLQACGIFEKIRNEVMNNKDIHSLAKIEEKEPLTILQLLACLILWGSGIFLAIIIFTGEICSTMNINRSVNVSPPSSNDMLLSQTWQLF